MRVVPGNHVRSDPLRCPGHQRDSRGGARVNTAAHCVLLVPRGIRGPRLTIVKRQCFVSNKFSVSLREKAPF